MSLELSGSQSRNIRRRRAGAQKPGRHYKFALSITLMCSLVAAASTSPAQALSAAFYGSESFLISYLTGSAGQDDKPDNDNAQTNFSDSRQFKPASETSGVSIFAPISTVVDDDGMGTAANCDAAVPSSSTIAEAYSVASPGDTITVCPGTYTLPSTVAISKANLTILGAGPAKPVIEAASAIGNAFFIGAPGVTLQNLEIKKTDLPDQALVAVQADNFTAANNLIYGPDPGMTWNAAGIISRGFVISANNNINLIGNTIHHLRQPAYISGGAATGGNITGNNVSGTKGWVVEGGNYLFTANTFGEPQNQSCDIALLATLAPLNNAFYEPLLALSSANDNAFICAQYGTPVNGRAIAYVNATSSPGNGSDNENYTTIQAGIDGTLPGGTVQVAAGGYIEDVLVNKNVKVLGAGQASTTIGGPLTGSSSTVAVAASGVEISGFTITRLGNNTTNWNTTVKTVGLSVQGGFTGMNIHDNRFTGNRSAIDINNSSGHSIHNNVITDNRTGLIMRNQTDNLSIVQNEITNNWTVGLLFLDGSGGTNSPAQRCLGCVAANNSFSGNWYGAIVDRQSGGSLPAPGINLKNFGSNWLGTNTPVVTTANSAEPGYAAQIPVEFGGTAVPPGGQPDVAGPASANFDYSPFLDTGVDGNATYGFQGSFATLNVASGSPQAAAGAPGNIREGIDLVDAGGILKIGPGTYAGNVNVNKAVNVKGIFTLSGTLNVSNAGAALSPGNSPGIINSGDLSLGSGTTVNIELNGTTVGTQYDQLNVTGAVSIASNVVLNVTAGFTPGAGNTFTIVNNDGGDAVSGTFKNLPEGTVFFVGPNSFSISYVGGTGNDIVLSAVSLCNAVSIPTNITTQTATTVTAGINVDDTTGHGLFSTDFDLTYNSAVLASPVVSLTGSITDGSVLTVNNPSPGLLRVSIFNSTPFAGAGTLANVTFNVNGLPGSSTALAFTAFKFNEGTPCISTSNGLVTVIGGTITGAVTYGNALVGPAPPRFVPNVSISGAGSPTVSATTNGSGTYSLSGFGPGVYTRSASKVSTTGPGSDASAISSFDAARIAQHVVGISPLVGNQLIVADVSGFGGITSFDASLIARYTVLLPGTGLTGNWVFVPPSYGPSTVFANISGENYSALLMGDVTGNWGAAGPFRIIPGRYQKPTTVDGSDTKPTRVDAPRMTAPSGSEVVVPINVRGTSGKGIISYQYEMRYDPAVLQPDLSPVDTTSSMSSGLFVTANVGEPGLLRVSVFGAFPLAGDGVLLNLRFTAIGAAGTISPLTWERLVLNEGGPNNTTTDGQVEVTSAAPDEAELGGRLLTAMGEAVPNTRVTITGTTGASRSILTNAFGYYRFGALHIGETYTISVEARRYTFNPITVSISGQLTDVDIIAEP